MSVPYSRQSAGKATPIVLCVIGCLSIVAPLLTSGSRLFQVVPVYLGIILISILVTFGYSLKTAWGLHADYSFGEGLRRTCAPSTLLIECGEGQVFDNNSYAEACNIAYMYCLSMAFVIVTLNALLVGILKYQGFNTGFVPIYGLLILLVAGLTNLVLAVKSSYDFYQRLKPASGDIPLSNDLSPPNNPKLTVAALIWYPIAIGVVAYISQNNLTSPRFFDNISLLFKYAGLAYIALVVLAGFGRVFGPLSTLMQIIVNYSENAYNLTQGLNTPDNWANTAFNEYFINNYRDYEGTNNLIGIRQKLTAPDSRVYKYLNVATPVTKTSANAVHAAHAGSGPFTVAMDETAYDAYQSLRGKGIEMGDYITEIWKRVTYPLYLLVFIALVIPFHQLFKDYAYYLGNSMILTVVALVLMLAVYSVKISLAN